MISRLMLLALLTGGLVFAVALPVEDAAYAATTKKKKGGLKDRSAYTAEQRQKILDAARKVCRKKYGAPANVYRIDYGSNRIWCTTN